jgi:U3 small nucleolar RNA-associated protein 25
MEHLEEVLKAVNKFPKQRQDLNDISRIKDVYSDKLAHHLRQTIVVQKFRNLDLDYVVSSFCQTSLFGNLKVMRQYPNKIREASKNYGIKFNLKRLNVDSIENQDDVRYNYFTKKMWSAVYEEGQNYTVLFVPQYFDFVKLRNFIK